jgi:hypothetical protein
LQLKTKGNKQVKNQYRNRAEFEHFWNRLTDATKIALFTFYTTTENYFTKSSLSKGLVGEKNTEEFARKTLKLVNAISHGTFLRTRDVQGKAFLKRLKSEFERHGYNHEAILESMIFALHRQCSPK